MEVFLEEIEKNIQIHYTLMKWIFINVWIGLFLLTYGLEIKISLENLY